MTDLSWRVEEPESETLTVTSPSRGLVSLHFLVVALRRQWRVWVGLGCLGMLLGAAYAVVTPPPAVGTVSLLLAHDPSLDPAQAMATDVSLLRTETVANDVIRRLHLQESPYDFQGSVVAQTPSTTVLTLEVSGPTGADAVARAKALVNSYLKFRTAQVRFQADTLVSGYEKRIADLRKQWNDLSKQYDQMRKANPGDNGRASAVLNSQSQVGAQIENAQQAIQDASLKSGSIIAASHVLDQPALKPGPSTLKRLVFAVASGVIGCTAIGLILVIVMALIDDRLRLREEVALALDAPVRVSVGSLRARPSWLPFRRASDPSRNLQLLVHAMDREVARVRNAQSTASSPNGRPREAALGASTTRLCLAAVDNVDAAQAVIAGLAAKLSAEGLAVFVVDLTEKGRLDSTLTSAVQQQEASSSGNQPVLYRPDGVPSLSRGPVDLSSAITTDLPPTDPRRSSWDKADVALTLAEVDPAIGVEHVRSWADQVVVLVTAGRTSGERLRTVGELIRTVGLRLLFAMLVGSDRTDDSVGLPEATGLSDARYAARTPG